MRLILKLSEARCASNPRQATDQTRRRAGARRLAGEGARDRCNSVANSSRGATASSELDDVTDSALADDLNDAAVVGHRRTPANLTGDDFDAFWQYTFKTMSIDEIASAHGISRQGMTKRIDTMPTSGS